MTQRTLLCWAGRVISRLCCATGMSLRETAAAVGVAVNTVRKVRTALAEE